MCCLFYCGFWYLRCLDRWRSTTGTLLKGHMTICGDVVEKKKKKKNVETSVLKAASALTVALHWSIGLCEWDCLTPVQASPPSLPGMPCAPGCSPGSEPSPGRPGATSEWPGRCSQRTHLSPGSQRPARTWQKQKNNSDFKKKISGQWQDRLPFLTDWSWELELNSSFLFSIP